MLLSSIVCIHGGLGLSVCALISSFGVPSFGVPGFGVPSFGVSGLHPLLLRFEAFPLNRLAISGERTREHCFISAPALVSGDQRPSLLRRVNHLL